MTIEVKKSKFVTLAWPVECPKAAMDLIESASDPSASHNCWAWQIGADTRSSDDGEPSGTAGRPILSAIQGEGLDFTCVLVTRYFGGTKLGTGGLVRAYGGAARDCLRGAPKAFRQAKGTLDLELDFKQLALVYGQLGRWGARKLGEESYSEGGIVQVAVELDADKEEEFISMIGDLTAGAFNPRRRELREQSGKT